MFVKKISLKNFKRFSELIIDLSSSNDPKLILLIGANGSGKSSIMDVFQGLKNGGFSQKDYYAKDTSYYSEILFETEKNKFEQKNQGSNLYQTDRRDFIHNIFCRSSVRIVPQPQRKGYNEKQYEDDSYAPKRSIIQDERFHYDLEHYVRMFNKALRQPAFAGEDTLDIRKIREQYIGSFNAALARIFGGGDNVLSLVDIEDTSETSPANLIFAKGEKKDISYHLLSHGEKQVIILVLNFLINQETFKDSLLFIDEMDNHLHTSLQYNLLKEITENWLPQGCQLRTASHALGFIDYAKNNPDDCVIIDFDNLDFDKAQTLTPKYEENVYDIAVPESVLGSLFNDKTIVFCENRNDELYNSMGFIHNLFVGLNNRDTVFVRTIKESDPKRLGLIDRDFLSDKEKDALQKKYPHLRILDYYCFENYLYHPKNIAEVVPGFDEAGYIQSLKEYKNKHFIELGQQLSSTRNRMEALKDPHYPQGLKKDTEEQMIIKAIKAEDFDIRYPFLSMKKGNGDRSFLESYNLLESSLAQTQWMKQKIQAIITK